MQNLKTSILIFFLEETEKPLPAESVDRTTHNNTKKGTESIILKYHNERAAHIR
jgi:hypothetical protein